MRSIIIILILVLLPMGIFAEWNLGLHPAYNIWANYSGIRYPAIYTLKDESICRPSIIGTLTYYWNNWGLGLYSGLLGYHYLELSLTEDDSIIQMETAYSIPVMLSLESHHTDKKEKQVYFKYKAMLGFHCFQESISRNYALLDVSYDYYPAVGIGIGFENQLLPNNNTFNTGIEIDLDLTIVFSSDYFQTYDSYIFFMPSIGFWYKF